MKILVGGSVAIDNVKTPSADEKNLLGGSASYAALAASKLSSPVHLVGVVGYDFPEEHLEMLSSKGVDLSGLERSEKASFTWTGEYHENMNDRTTHEVAINVLEDWQVKVPSDLKDAEFVLLANMAPLTELHQVLKRIDLLVINEGEAREFAGTNNLVLAGEILRGKGPEFVVIKLGEFGALLFGPGEKDFFRCGAWPLRDLADPTGAGDTFLGGMAGYLAKEKATKPTFDQLRKAVVQGSMLASFTCEAFSTRALEDIDSDILNKRLATFREISAW